MEINFSNPGIFLVFFTIAFADSKVREALEIAARVAAREKDDETDCCVAVAVN